MGPSRTLGPICAWPNRIAALVTSATYCDHQENRKSVIGRDHLRVPSGVPLPAVGLSAASGLSLESTQRGTTASRWAECSEWTVYQPMG